MKEFTQFYINGQWLEPIEPKSFNVINPATEEACGVISLGCAADVDQAVAAARNAFESWSQTSREQRMDVLKKIISVYEQHYNDVVEAVMLEMGAPKSLASSAQAAMGLGHIKTALGLLSQYEFEHTLGTTEVIKEPVGVVGMITPWNWPMNQMMCKVAPAMAAGCTMVLKPSEIAPLSAYVFAQIVHEAGVPAGVFNLVNGEGPVVGDYMAGHPDIDMMTFTGSTRAGVSVAKRSADTVKRVTLELGGKSPNIILDDADFPTAVGGGVIGCMSNTGQSCNAPTRMLIPNSHMDEAVAIAKTAAEKALAGVGDPTSDTTRIGPIANKNQYEKVNSMIQKGIDEGATLVAGGLGRPNNLEKGYFIKPTVFANVTNDMTIAQEEIFGPVLCIIGYDTEEEAIKIANDTPYGLSGYVSSGDPERAKRVARQLRTGMVHLNGASVDLMAPFGGYKMSGNGREWGQHGLDDFLEVKAVMGWNPA